MLNRNGFITTSEKLLTLPLKLKRNRHTYVKFQQQKKILLKIPNIYSCYLSDPKLYSVLLPNLIRFSESPNKDFKS